MDIARRFVENINPYFQKWDELDWILAAFENWESDVAEPPSSGAFITASASNDLAAGCSAFFACSGSKHLPFEEAILFYKKNTFLNICFSKGRKVGFGHPVYSQDPRVEKYFNTFRATGNNLKNAKEYVEIKQGPCLNFAGLYGMWCVENGLDERAAILPLISRLFGLVCNYKSNNGLPSTHAAISNFALSGRAEDQTI